jgi:hypothetical protein
VLVGFTSAQFAPESVDVQMFPVRAVAASLVPSLDIAMPYATGNAAYSLDVHVSPESADVHTVFPPDGFTQVVTMSMVPSLDDAMYLYLCVLPVGLTSVQVEALTKASEANESNTASRTRSMVLGSTSLTGTFIVWP